MPKLSHAPRVRFAGVLATVGAALVLAGCSQNIFHDAGKAKLSADAKAAYEKLDINAAVKSVGVNFASLKKSYKEATAALVASSKNRVLYDSLNPPERRATLRGFLNAHLNLGAADYERPRRLGIESVTGIPDVIETLRAVQAAGEALKQSERAVVDLAGQTLPCFALETPLSDKAGVDWNDPKVRTAADAYLDYIVETGKMAGLETALSDSKKRIAELKEKIKGLRGQAKADAGKELASLEKRVANDEKRKTNLRDRFEKNFERCAVYKSAIAKVYGHNEKNPLASMSEVPPPAICDDEVSRPKLHACRLLSAMNEAGAKFGDVRSLTGKYLAAQKEYKAIAGRNKDMDKADEQSRKDLDKALKAVESALKALESSEKLVGIDIVTEERLKAINGLIETVKTGKVDEKAFADPNLQRAATVVATLNSLASIAKSFKAREKALELQRLQVARDIAEARRDWVKAAIDRNRREVDIRLNFLRLYAEELTLFEKIDGSLLAYLRSIEDGNGRVAGTVVETGNEDGRNDPVRKPKPCRVSVERDIDVLIPPREGGCDPLGALKTTDFWATDMAVEKRKHLVKALIDVALIKAANDLGAWNEIVDVSFLSSERAVDQSEMSARMWNAVIGGPLEQLETYYKGGVMPATLADLIVKIGILAGVNR